MAATELRAFLEEGNIVNSVNYPTCAMAREGSTRITIMHKNVQGMLSQFSAIVSDEHINIVNMLNKSKKDAAYTIMDIDGDASAEIEKKILAIDGVLKIRIIK